MQKHIRREEQANILSMDESDIFTPTVGFTKVISPASNPRYPSRAPKKNVQVASKVPASRAKPMTRLVESRKDISSESESDPSSDSEVEKRKSWSSPTHRPKRGAGTAPAVDVTNPITIFQAPPPASLSIPNVIEPPRPPNTASSVVSSVATKVGASEIGGGEEPSSTSTSQAPYTITDSMKQKMMQFIDRQRLLLETINQNPITKFGRFVKGALAQDMSKVFSNYDVIWTKPSKLIAEVNRETLAVALDVLYRQHEEGAVGPSSLSRLPGGVDDLLKDYSGVMLSYITNSIVASTAHDLSVLDRNVVFTGQLEFTDETKTAIVQCIERIGQTVAHLASADNLQYYIQDSVTSAQFATLVARQMVENGLMNATRPFLQKQPKFLAADIQQIMAFFHTCTIQGLSVVKNTTIVPRMMEKLRAAREYLGMDGYLQNTQSFVSRAYPGPPPAMIFISE